VHEDVRLYNKKWIYRTDTFDEGEAYRAELELFLLDESSGLYRLADCLIFFLLVG
jgi:hypothetical protein